MDFISSPSHFITYVIYPSTLSLGPITLCHCYLFLFHCSHPYILYFIAPTHIFHCSHPYILLLPPIYFIAPTHIFHCSHPYISYFIAPTHIFHISLLPPIYFI